MSHYAEETYTSYVEPTHTARKEHTCDACKETIHPGHQYTRVYTLFDGKKTTIKRCARCQTIHLHLRELCQDAEEMWPDERLNCGRDYEDEWDEPPPGEIAALAFALPGETKL